MGICRFLGVDYDSKMLEHHKEKGRLRAVDLFPQNPKALLPAYDSSIGRWKIDLSLEEKTLFKELAGGLLMELGYEKDRNW